MFHRGCRNQPEKTDRGKKRGKQQSPHERTGNRVSNDKQPYEYAQDSCDQVQDNATPSPDPKRVYRFYDAAYNKYPTQCNYSGESSDGDREKCDSPENEQKDSECEKPSPSVTQFFNIGKQYAIYHMTPLRNVQRSTRSRWATTFRPNAINRVSS